jgi:hypothetical protein
MVVMTEAKTDNVTNKYNVPRKQWQRWTFVAKQVFNKTYGDSKENQEVFSHPMMTINGGIEKDHWETISWNHAFYAADVCSRGEKNFLKGYKE